MQFGTQFENSELWSRVASDLSVSCSYQFNKSPNHIVVVSGETFNSGELKFTFLPAIKFLFKDLSF